MYGVERRVWRLPTVRRPSVGMMGGPPAAPQVEGAVHANVVVKRVVEIFAPNGADQSFHE